MKFCKALVKFPVQAFGTETNCVAVEQCLFFVSVRAQNTNNHCVDGYIIIHWLRAQRKKHQFGPRIIIISINLGTAQKNPTQYLHPVKFSELVAPIPVFWLFM